MFMTTVYDFAGWFLCSLAVLYLGLRLLIWVIGISAPLHDDWDEDDAVAEQFKR